jgi:hypothetical protein
MHQRKQRPNHETDWLEIFQPSVKPIPTLMPGRRKPSRKRDLRGRLADILAKRLEARHGLSPEEARARAEKLVRLSGGEPPAPPLHAKIVPIR